MLKARAGSGLFIILHTFVHLCSRTQTPPQCNWTSQYYRSVGWSYLFIVYCQYGRFGQSGWFGHVTVHSQLGFGQLDLCLACPKNANCRDLAAQAELAGRRARGQIPF